MSKTVLIRIAWNRFGWRKADSHGPSDGGFPADTGRAGEDWNFALQNAVKGKLVGFSQGLPGRKAVKASGGRFNVVFFAKHPDEGYGIVGVYRDAELLGESGQTRWWQRLKDKRLNRWRWARWWRIGAGMLRPHINVILNVGQLGGTGMRKFWQVR